MSEQYDGYSIHLAMQELDKLDLGGTPARGPIDAVWRAVEGGNLPHKDMAEWAQIIAKRVVPVVLDDKEITDQRSNRALQALGLYGVEDRNWHERRALELYVDFERFAVTEDDEKLTSRTPGRRKRMLEYMKAQGFYDGLSREDALKRIDRLVEKIPQGS